MGFASRTVDRLRLLPRDSNPLGEKAVVMRLSEAGWVFVLFVGLSLAGKGSTAWAQFGSFFGGGSVETIDLPNFKAIAQARLAATQDVDQQLPEQTKNLAKGYVIVDVRSEREVKVSIIPGAITKKQYEQAIERYKDRTAVVYCTIGGRSAQYAKELKGKGITVKNFKGSILQWVQAGLPVVTPDGEPTNRVHTYSSRYKIPDRYEQVTD